MSLFLLFLLLFFKILCYLLFKFWYKYIEFFKKQIIMDEF